MAVSTGSLYSFTLWSFHPLFYAFLSANPPDFCTEPSFVLSASFRHKANWPKPSNVKNPNYKVGILQFGD